MKRQLRSPLTCALFFVLFSCATDEEPTAGIEPQVMADSMHAVMHADRTVYSKHVVNRLQNVEGVISATEHWKDDKALPLPAQMFRMGAELASEGQELFSYALLSKWPVNKKNAPRTEAEKAGLDFVAKNVGSNYYGEEELGGRRWFTAVYADQAVSPACVLCHNAHPDSPRNDFELGDVMGGVVIRIALD
jgi:uncharacterized protein DUF3365